MTLTYFPPRCSLMSDSEALRSSIWTSPSLRDRRIGLLGLAFKPDTDDIRDAPALDPAVRLLSPGASVVAYDPVVSPTPWPELTIVADLHTVATGADAIVLATQPSNGYSQRFRCTDEVGVDIGRNGSAAGNGQRSTGLTPTNTPIPLSS
jgi:UDP-N-acetyl-D-mannosaminuronate dehydrogenase